MRARVVAAVVVALVAVGCRDGTSSTPSTTGIEPTATTPTTVAPTTSAPAATSAPRATGSAGPSAANFTPVSATFVSAQTGWVLDQPLGGALRLWQTRDAGLTWSQFNAPPIAPTADEFIHYGVRFADLQTGYVFGRQLWTTHDGGSSWTQVAYPRAADFGYVEHLEIAGRIAYALIVTGDGDHRYRMTTTPTDRDNFAEIYAYGQSAAPVQDAQLVAQGDRAFALFNFRVLSGGEQAINGAAVAWQPPCLGSNGPALLAASSASEVVAYCIEGTYGGTRRNTLRVSHDAGATFAIASQNTDITQSGSCLASSSPTTVVLGGRQFTATFNGGATWSTVWPGSDNSVCGEIGFTTATQGVAILTGQNPALLMTRDGGHSWSRVTI